MTHYNAVIKDTDERAPLWKSVTGTNEMPVTSPVAWYHGGHQAYIHMIDMDRLTLYQRNKITRRIAERDGLSIKQVRRDAREFGVGLNAKGVTIVEDREDGE